MAINQDHLVDSSKSLFFLLPDKGGLKVSKLFVGIFKFFMNNSSSVVNKMLFGV